MDGADDYQVYEQAFLEDAKSVGDDSHIFFVCYAPLILRAVSSHKKIWENPSPFSTNFCRPIRLIFEKETGEFVRDIHDQITSEIESLTSVQVNLGNGKEITASFSLVLTMVDGEVFNLITRASSNACPLCRASLVDLNDFLKHFCQRIPPVDFIMSILHAKQRTFDHLSQIAITMDLKTCSTKVPLRSF